MNDEQMQPLSEHLGELRRRIIWVLAFFVIALIFSFMYSIRIFRFIKEDLFAHYSLNTFKPLDPIHIYMQISFILALVITSPVILYHLWQFVRPGLKPHEQRSALLYIPVMIALFLGGLFFGYFIVFPYMMEFVATLNKLMGIGAMYSVADAFDFLFNILLPLAFLFELPVVVLFLTRIRLITPALLIKGRRIAYFLLVVLAAMISPPDLTSNLIILIPLILIYEISVWISYLQYQRMLREEENGGV